jgi:hypothetical protein
MINRNSLVSLQNMKIFISSYSYKKNNIYGEIKHSNLSEIFTFPLLSLGHIENVTDQ